MGEVGGAGDTVDGVYGQGEALELVFQGFAGGKRRRGGGWGEVQDAHHAPGSVDVGAVMQREDGRGTRENRPGWQEPTSISPGFRAVGEDA